MFFFDKQKIGLNNYLYEETMTELSILILTYIIVSPKENDIEDLLAYLPIQRRKNE